MDVSVIIVTYNTLALTRDCIDSIFRHTANIQFEVIIVDNASEDGSYDYFSKDRRIIYVHSRENMGFGRANNLGLEYASGKYIFLLNSDTYLKNNAIKIFKDAMDVEPESVVCLGAILEDSSGMPVRSYGPFLSFGQFFVRSLRSTPPRSVPVDGFIVPVVIGADLFIRRDIIEKEGFFDPVFFMYHEENDLQRRYAAAGCSSKIIAGPQIVHLEGKSSKSRINMLAIGGGFIYMKKWTAYGVYLLYRILYAITRFPKVFFVEAPFCQKIKFLSVLFFYKAPATHLRRL